MWYEALNYANPYVQVLAGSVAFFGLYLITLPVRVLVGWLSRIFSLPGRRRAVKSGE